MEDELVVRKRHVAKKCVQNCLGKADQGRTKFWWCAFCGEETARCRKEASKVVQVKAALGRKNGSGVGEFLGGKRHVAEKCVQSCLGERRHVPDEVLVVVILWGGSGTWQKKASNVDRAKATLKSKSMEEELVVRKRHLAEKCESPRGRKKASKVDRVKAVLGVKNGRGVGGKKTALGQTKCRAVFGEETAFGRKKMCRCLLWRKPPEAGQNPGGKDFVGRKRHGLEVSR
ncbi:hypothetical protein T11_13328 [Trichinella zimbabwensis]|uniref:Uncharacterized protein n=1 Tax=Trichinella zimbabwensis TaxID=268475 RepID=A0A0V1GLX0_9BILA|nr:hypothetical protein T11_13328 [Trichinella zimbabwensis]